MCLFVFLVVVGGDVAAGGGKRTRVLFFCSQCMGGHNYIIITSITSTMIYRRQRTKLKVVDRLVGCRSKNLCLH